MAPLIDNGLRSSDVDPKCPVSLPSQSKTQTYESSISIAISVHLINPNSPAPRKT